MSNQTISISLYSLNSPSFLPFLPNPKIAGDWRKGPEAREKGRRGKEEIKRL